MSRKHIAIIGATSAIAEHCARLWVEREPLTLTLIGRDEEKLRRIAAAYLADIGNPDHGRQQIRFHNLLADSEHSFTAQHLQLTNQQQEQLDTQIQVLRDQLKTGNQP